MKHFLNEAEWMSKWEERENLFYSIFGNTIPPKTVHAFDWGGALDGIPGACTMTFPPGYNGRKTWITLSHGLTQWPVPLVGSKFDTKFHQYEIIIETEQREQWPIHLIGLLLTYIKRSEAKLEPGHRIPIWLNNTASPMLNIGKAPQHFPIADEISSILFWNSTLVPDSLSTSLGSFIFLSGLTVTDEELRLARKYSVNTFFDFYNSHYSSTASLLQRKSLAGEFEQFVLAR